MGAGLEANALATLPAAVLQGLAALKYLIVGANRITTLTGSVFAGLDGLVSVTAGQNPLDCGALAPENTTTGGESHLVFP